VTTIEVAVYRAALGLCDWPGHEGCPDWEVRARRIADRAMGTSLVMGASIHEAETAWGEAFEAARLCDTLQQHPGS
jgi:hypothetical protein